MQDKPEWPVNGLFCIFWATSVVVGRSQTKGLWLSLARSPPLGQRTKSGLCERAWSSVTTEEACSWTPRGGQHLWRNLLPSIVELSRPGSSSHLCVLSQNRVQHQAVLGFCDVLGKLCAVPCVSGQLQGCCLLAQGSPFFSFLGLNGLSAWAQCGCRGIKLWAPPEPAGS